MSRTKGLLDFEKKHSPTYRHEPAPQRSRQLTSTSRYLVTWAQNATPVDPEFWRVLMATAEALGAELLVIPGRYKNPTSLWTASQQNAEWWAEEVRPYLWDVRHAFNDNLMLMADWKIQAAAGNPLERAEAVSMASSGLYGSPKIASKTIAIPGHKMAKLLMTSGACTQPNYSDTKIGKIAEFHHSLSCVLVEVKDAKRFFCRRLQFSKNTQSFIDLGIRYTVKGAIRASRSKALVQGDTHVERVDPRVDKATFGEGGIVERTRPEFIVWHDLLNGHSVSPYSDPVERIALWLAGQHNVKREVAGAIDWVRERTPKDAVSVIVLSNHNEWLKRWIFDTDWRTLGASNVEYYLQNALDMVRSARMTLNGPDYDDPFVAEFKKADLPNVKVLAPGETFNIGDWTLGFHGHKAPGGARGSVKAFSRMGVKSITGHGHEPGEEEGARRTGTSTLLTQTYNRDAPSKQLNAHFDLNADEKAQMIVIAEGEFCL